jgi:hypothetical protein
MVVLEVPVPSVSSSEARRADSCGLLDELCERFHPSSPGVARRPAVSACSRASSRFPAVTAPAFQRVVQSAPRTVHEPEMSSSMTNTASRFASVLWRVGNRMILFKPSLKVSAPACSGNCKATLLSGFPGSVRFHQALRQTESPNPIPCDSVVKKHGRPDQSVLRPRDAIVSCDHPGDKGFFSRRRNMVSIRGRSVTELMASTAITGVASTHCRRST